MGTLRVNHDLPDCLRRTRDAPLETDMKTPACLLALALASTFAAAPVMAVPAMHAPAATAVPAAPQLDAALRSLWHGHIVHTREYALAVHAHDSAKAQTAADAVVANAKQIAHAVGGFYGKSAGARMLDLLAGHWGGVKALTDARAANDSAAQQKAMSTLDTNAHAIATFLSGANRTCRRTPCTGCWLRT